MAIPETPGVSIVATRLQELLTSARQLKTSTEIEPPLPEVRLHGDLGLPLPPDTPRAQYFSAVECAARRLYQECAASTSIHSPEFIEIWNLLDILSVCGDQDQCDPALVWWLVEELLETQSIDGCRVVFDYLESRRDRLLGRSFEKKNLIVLRAFNELLRRLSRAEESVFCGRVFVFLFQTFPLGAQSSVNRKGDFHEENITTFEDLSVPDFQCDGEDQPVGEVELAIAERAEPAVDSAPALQTVSQLYQSFWTMQQAFSNPPEYFFKQNKLEEFKPILEATLTKFKQVPKVNQAAADHRGTKRKTGGLDAQDEFASTFNPKYLTSQELFALELSDLAFQRHILVQALILLDFLLSLTEKMKKGLVGFPNKSVQYDYTLSAGDAYDRAYISC